MSDTTSIPPDLGTEHVLLEVADRVATLVLNRPEKLNAVTPEMSRALVRAVEWCDTTDDVRAVILTGAAWARLQRRIGHPRTRRLPHAVGVPQPRGLLRRHS